MQNKDLRVSAKTSRYIRYNAKRKGIFVLNDVYERFVKIKERQNLKRNSDVVKYLLDSDINSNPVISRFVSDHELSSPDDAIQKISNILPDTPTRAKIRRTDTNSVLKESKSLENENSNENSNENENEYENILLYGKYLHDECRISKRKLRKAISYILPFFSEKYKTVRVPSLESFDKFFASENSKKKEIMSAKLKCLPKDSV